MAPDSPTAALVAATMMPARDLHEITNALILAFLTGADLAAVLSSDLVRAGTSPLR